jgi:hypothetical protein
MGVIRGFLQRSFLVRVVNFAAPASIKSSSGLRSSRPPTTTNFGVCLAESVRCKCIISDGRKTASAVVTVSHLRNPGSDLEDILHRKLNYPRVAGHASSLCRGGNAAEISRPNDFPRGLAASAARLS